MKLAEKVIKIHEALPTKLNWLGNLKTVHDKNYPKPEGISEEPQHVSVVDFDSLKIYIYSYKWEGGGWMGNAPQSWMMVHNGKVVAKSDAIQTSDEVTVDAQKAYKKISKEANASIDIPKGKKVADPEANEWTDTIPERKEAILKALADMEEFEESGEIYKSDWTNLKDLFDTAVIYAQEACFDAAMKAADISGTELKNIKDLYKELSKNKRVVHLEKALVDVKASEGIKFFVKLFIKPMVDIYAKLEVLKGKIKSGRKPVINPAKAAYVPPMSAKKDIEKVNAVYEELLKDTKKGLIESITKHMTSKAEKTLSKLKSLSDDTKNKLRGGKIRFDWAFISTWYNSSKNKTDTYDFSGYELKKDYKEIASKEAEQQAESIQRQFIYKNLKKVSSIVGVRGGLDTADVTGINMGAGRLEGRVTFKFVDGGEFSVNNQVVFIWETDDRVEHHRFPTTFHNIKFSNGKSSKMESEEFMNKVWAVENKNKNEGLKLAESVLIAYGIKESNALDKKYADNKEAMDMIRAEMDNMAQEIKDSNKGQRSGFKDPTKMAGEDEVNTSSKSTFPEYLQDIFNGSGTAQKFHSAVKMGKGIVWSRIALAAIDRLENGYKNQHGYDEPSQEFMELIK
jgi:hypothetical protein